MNNLQENEDLKTSVSINEGQPRTQRFIFFVVPKPPVVIPYKIKNGKPNDDVPTRFCDTSPGESIFNRDINYKFIRAIKGKNKTIHIILQFHEKDAQSTEICR